MAMGRITVPLTTNERQALVTIAERECRDPREHLRYLIRREAQALGLLPDDRGVGTKEKAAFRSDRQTQDDQETASAPVS